MTYKSHSRSSAMSAIVRLPGRSITDRKCRLCLFQTKMAEMTLNVDQGHRRWHNSIDQISLSVSGL